LSSTLDISYYNLRDGDGSGTTVVSGSGVFFFFYYSLGDEMRNKGGDPMEVRNFNSAGHGDEMTRECKKISAAAWPR